MNKQELIEKYKELEAGSFDIAAIVVCQLVLKDLEQLDELEKVQIPQFVADWYEENKDDFEISLFQCVYEIFKKRNDNELNEFEIWLIDENTKPFQTLVNMHQFGYEVEKEKRYLVKVKGIVNVLSFLGYHKKADMWTLKDINNSDGSRTHHTRKQLEEAGFSWVFDCPGIEIEEVTE